MSTFENIIAPVQALSDEITRQHGISLSIKREDLNHPEIMGNKLRKLKYNLLDAQKQNASALLSFGGAYSNHILALSAAGKLMGMQTIGIIRGAELENTPLNSVLSRVLENDMQLHFVSRSDYRKKQEAEFIEKLHEKFGAFYLIPEGGSNQLALQGVSELMSEVDDSYDVISCACGTGGTLAGLIQGAGINTRHSPELIGFQVLKADNYIQQAVHDFLTPKDYQHVHWHVNQDYHFGGYAKTDDRLIGFMRWFKAIHNIDLDYVYTGKMMYGLYQMIKSGSFSRGSRVLAIHTGGTQTASLSCLQQ